MDGWSLEFHINANYISVINYEDNYIKKIPLGKNTFKYIIECIDKHNTESSENTSEIPF